MEAKQPTQEQIKEFWEWCGFKPCRMRMPLCPETDGWENPMPVTSFDRYDRRLPDIDLNNLFKYAVPKFGDDIDIEFYPLKGKCCCSLTQTGNDNTIKDYRFKNQDTYALALFWAIWEVIHGS